MKLVLFQGGADADPRPGLLTGRGVWYSGLRQVLFGLLAAEITFGLGRVIGTTLAG